MTLEEEVAPFVSRMVREGLDAQGGKSALPIWRLADVLQPSRPGGSTLVHIDGDDSATQTTVLNGCSEFLAPGYRVRVLLVEPHGAWIEGIVNRPVTALYVGAHRERAAGGVIASGTVPVTIDMATPDSEYDPYMFWQSDTVLTVPTGFDGRYLICANVAVAGNAAGMRRIFIALNGALTKWGTTDFNSGLSTAHIQVIGTLDLVGTDTIEIRVAQNSGAPLSAFDRIVSIDRIA